MRSNFNYFSDEKFRSIFFQTLVIGLFALGIYFIVTTTAYNLEKRNIATGWRFLTDPAGFDISFSPFLDFKSTDTHLKVYYVGVLNTLLVSVTGCIANKRRKAYVKTSSIIKKTKTSCYISFF